MAWCGEQQKTLHIRPKMDSREREQIQSQKMERQSFNEEEEEEEKNYKEMQKKVFSIWIEWKICGFWLV